MEEFCTPKQKCKIMWDNELSFRLERKTTNITLIIIGTEIYLTLLEKRIREWRFFRFVGIQLLSTKLLLSSYSSRISKVRSKLSKLLHETFVMSLVWQALTVISIKSFLVISMLCKTERSWELRTWSHKMNLLNDFLSTSPHYFCRKWIGATNENSNFLSMLSISTGSLKLV